MVLNMQTNEYGETEISSVNWLYWRTYTFVLGTAIAFVTTIRMRRMNVCGTSLVYFCCLCKKIVVWRRYTILKKIYHVSYKSVKCMNNGSKINTNCPLCWGSHQYWIIETTNSWTKRLPQQRTSNIYNSLPF